MKKLFLILLFAWICIENSNIYAFPVSAPNSENPASPIEKAESPIAKASPSGSNTNSQNTREGEYVLEEIRVTILSGMNQNGSKAHKVDYRVASASEDKNLKKNPAVKVIYKNAADKKVYTVSEVRIKTNPSNSSSYKVMATVIPAESERAIIPKIIYEK